MALIACPECKKNISESAVSCPNCGYKLTPEKIAEIKKVELPFQGCLSKGCLWIFALSFALLFIVSIVSYITTSDFPSYTALPSSRSSTSSSNAVVKNSAWDGSVSQVESWLKANVKDPGSLEFIEWSTVAKTNDGGFMVRVKYRAKNSFGGYVVENKMFSLNSAGTVTNSMDY